MLRKALAIYSLTIGFAVLALAMPPAIKAQLPDAPSVVKARQLSARILARNLTGANQNDSFGWTRIPAFDSTEFQERISFDFASASTLEADAIPQQPLYRPSKHRVPPGFSSSVAEIRPVPGSAPALHNPCPNNTCALAQTIMCCGPSASPFERYLKTPGAVPLTARDNLHSAVMHVIDPFNLITIAGDSAIGVASDPHSPYGPGGLGFAKYSGVSLTEDMTGEFFGTFLIPSLLHQDPRYHREPFVPVRRRILHAFTQIVWTQSYTGKPMLNYANILGSIATAAVSNTFVPGPGRQGFANTSQRLAIAFAISPSGNLISEFVPDVANRINLRVVIFQRILNTVSIEESGVP